MTKAIGPTFPIELEAAGLLGLPFSWGADGTLNWGDAMTDQQKAAVLAVYEAHDPTKLNPVSPAEQLVTIAQLQAVLAAINPGIATEQIASAIAKSG